MEEANRNRLVHEVFLESEDGTVKKSEVVIGFTVEFINRVFPRWYRERTDIDGVFRKALLVKSIYEFPKTQADEKKKEWEEYDEKIKQERLERINKEQQAIEASAECNEKNLFILQKKDVRPL